MKKIFTFILIAALAAGTANAQHGKKPPTPKEAVKEMQKAQNQAKKDFENNKPPTPPGNAYGKDKQGLEGKEFGQQRAADAKTKREAQAAIQNNVLMAAQHQSDALAKLNAAREKLEGKKTAKQISDADYKLKKQAIENLEAEIKALEKRNNELMQKSQPSK